MAALLPPSPAIVLHLEAGLPPCSAWPCPLRQPGRWVPGEWQETPCQGLGAGRQDMGAGQCLEVPLSSPLEHSAERALVPSDAPVFPRPLALQSPSRYMSLAIGHSPNAFLKLNEIWPPTMGSWHKRNHYTLNIHLILAYPKSPQVSLSGHKIPTKWVLSFLLFNGRNCNLAESQQSWDSDWQQRPSCADYINASELCAGVLGAAAKLCCFNLYTTVHLRTTLKINIIMLTFIINIRSIYNLNIMIFNITNYILEYVINISFYTLIYYYLLYLRVYSVSRSVLGTGDTAETLTG